MTILKNWFSLKECDRKEKIKCIVMYILIAILVLVDIFMCFTLAKYIAKGNPAGDSARVAKFDVSITDTNGNALTDENLEMDLGKSLDPATYDFKVENNSEVAVEYTLVLTLTAEYDTSVLNITATADGGTPVNHGTRVEDTSSGTVKYVYTFPNVGKIAPGDSSDGQLVFGLANAEDTGLNTTLSNMDLEIVVSQID